MKIGYARKSQDKQDLAVQLQHLVAAGVELENIYSDSESGAKQADTRPGFAALQTRVTSGGIDEVVITEFSRIGRDAHDSVFEMLNLNRKGVKITSLAANEQFLTAVPVEAQLPLISMMAMGADIERKHISERTRWALALIKAGGKATKSGKPLGRPRIVVDWAKLDALMEKHGINETAARKILGYKHATFYNAKRQRKHA
jgi:DNA invertase Pin-like site-specific DNA recombinase